VNEIVNMVTIIAVVEWSKSWI